MSSHFSQSTGRTVRSSLWHDYGKPAVDWLVAAVGLVAIAPLLALIAFAVRLDSQGSILYRQTRVGRDRRRGRRGAYAGPERRQRNIGGAPFKIVKFRTMVEDAEAGTGAVWARGATDPRVTRLGKFLRASHMDELPQLLNVLRGDMSLVGPRPERPEFVVELSRKIPGYERRTRVRPGITGLAQVVHKYDETVDDVRRKVDYDLQYIHRTSPWLDARILFATVRKCWGEFRDLKARVSSRRQDRRRRRRSDTQPPRPARAKI